jgi:hypothetical protein
MESSTQTQKSQELIGMGAYCKCGRIVYAVLYDKIRNDIEAQHEIINHIYNGYKVENVSKEQVRKLFGCKCKQKLMF